jgi:hypothetical protein
MLKKICTKCKTGKPVAEFYTNKRMKDGLNTFCIPCHKADNLARKRRNRSDPQFKAAENATKREYRSRTTEHRRLYMQVWRTTNAMGCRQYGREYRQKNKAFCLALWHRRQKELLQRTPPWLTAEDAWIIQEIYLLAEVRTKATGAPWHVDHIIPLRGRTVSGLHVPANLQVIPWYENLRKSNHYEVGYGFT